MGRWRTGIHSKKGDGVKQHSTQSLDFVSAHQVKQLVAFLLLENRREPNDCSDIGRMDLDLLEILRITENKSDFRAVAKKPQLTLPSFCGSQQSSAFQDAMKRPDEYPILGFRRQTDLLQGIRMVPGDCIHLDA